MPSNSQTLGRGKKSSVHPISALGTFLYSGLTGAFALTLQGLKQLGRNHREKITRLGALREAESKPLNFKQKLELIFGPETKTIYVKVAGENAFFCAYDPSLCENDKLIEESMLDPKFFSIGLAIKIGDTENAEIITETLIRITTIPNETFDEDNYEAARLLAGMIGKNVELARLNRKFYRWERKCFTAPILEPVGVIAI